VPLSLVGLAALCLGCPAKVPTPEQATPNPSPVATPTDDPRVVRDGEDLYTVESAPHPLPSDPAPGSGRPDTTNGVCQLYAPKLSDPQCCPQETGFDAERIKQICGHALYMGESLQQSCGYFFLPDTEGSAPVSLRGSRINSEDVTTAAADHDMRLARITKNPAFASTPVPGVEGALWSNADGIHWAFLPGWPNVRQISWIEDACPIAKMPEVLKLIAEAKPPPANAPRLDLVPKARQ
jgi:hypothetical protein